MVYIPAAHRSYNLLPRRTAHGGEVFVYPDMRQLKQQMDACMRMGEELEPYGCRSRKAYDRVLIRLRNRYRAYPRAVKAIERYRGQIHDLNQKEKWSICQYVGPSSRSTLGLTSGRSYYWPCSATHPAYLGVIDDEEYTNYQYAPDPACWVILSDPTGMAARVVQRYQQQCAAQGAGDQ